MWHIAVIEVDGLTVIADTGVGNGRTRLHTPPLNHLDTGQLTALEAAGTTRAAAVCRCARLSTASTSTAGWKFSLPQFRDTGTDS